MTTAIKIEGLGKSYVIRHEQVQGYVALRDVLADGAKRLARRVFNPLAENRPRFIEDEFWALKDIDLEIAEGERIGIIGRNGAGKSTLLKILSRITAPTKGRITISGRVASLLEVGTGFHPELTGRENILLNGAILGMPRATIRRRFSDIVEFADIEKFLDTPVKRYSSGMYLRLAFSVAAHLEPDILVVDEVLAVGDAQFQKQCIGKMEEIGSKGRTVLFVSHSMAAVERICTSAILLDRGTIRARSENVAEVVREYMSFGDSTHGALEWLNAGDVYRNRQFTPARFYIGAEDGSVATGAQRNDEELYVFVEGLIDELDPSLQIGYAVYRESGELLYWSFHTDTKESEWAPTRLGRCAFKSRLPKRLLNEGHYRIDLGVALFCRQWLCEPGVRCPSLHLEISGGLSDSPYWTQRRPGLLSPVLPWHSAEEVQGRSPGGTSRP